MVALPHESPQDAQARHVAELDTLVAPIASAFPEVEIWHRVTSGYPPKVLIDMAGGPVPAQLLVLGSHGHNWLAEKLLGTVSGHCVRHSRCPVVVLPHHITEQAALTADPRAEVPLTPGPLY